MDRNYGLIKGPLLLLEQRSVDTTKGIHSTTRTTCSDMIRGRTWWKDDPKGSTAFWSKLWSEPVKHNNDSEWSKKVK